MADNERTSELAAAATLTGAELVTVSQSLVSVQTTTQDIADLGGAPTPLGSARTALIVDDAGSAAEWGYPSNLLNKSVVSGDATLGGGSAAAEVGTYADPQFLTGGGLGGQGGDLAVVDNPGAGSYLYFYANGGPGEFKGGDVTISGVCDLAIIGGGEAAVEGGDASAVGATGTPYLVEGGNGYLQGGNAENNNGDAANGARLQSYGATADGSSATGGPVQIAAGSVTAGTGGGGQIFIDSGTGFGGGADGTIELRSSGNSYAAFMRMQRTGGADKLSFFDAPVVARPSITVGDVADLLAALVALGLVTDDT